jgi:nucleoid-associated protein YgaU
MAKKAAVKKIKEPVFEEEPEKRNGFFDYLRFGESYTSLILGIIVVIIATALLLSFVHNKDAGNVNTPITQQTQNTVQVSQKANNLAQKAPNNTADTSVTAAPTETPVPTDTPVPTSKPTAMPQPTAKPKPTQVVKKIVKTNPTLKPTEKPKPTAVEKKIAKINPSPTRVPQIENGKGKNVWIVQKNESLWLIAEKKYSSGYNWVDIAKANNLADPSDIHVGDKLILPNVTPGPSTLAMEKPTVTTNDQQFSSTKRTNEIGGKTYTVVHGDTLWDIAVRAYGDGYRWPDIAKANNLANPGLIFSGNVLTIPR